MGPALTLSSLLSQGASRAQEVGLLQQTPGSHEASRVIQICFCVYNVTVLKSNINQVWAGINNFVEIKQKQVTREQNLTFIFPCISPHVKGLLSFRPTGLQPATISADGCFLQVKTGMWCKVFSCWSVAVKSQMKTSVGVVTLQISPEAAEKQAQHKVFTLQIKAFFS